MFLISCAKQGPPPSNYKEMDVSNGGTISGIVRWNGAKPTTTSIIVEKDQDACGTSHPNASRPGNGEGVAGVIVYLDSMTSGKAFPNTEKAALDQKGCEFIPHVQVVKAGTNVLVSNSDKVLHNFRMTMNGKPILNEVEPEGAPPHQVMLNMAGLNTVVCDVHPWMRGFVMVTEHPYYAITDSNGRYTLANVPPGRYTLKMWRDNWAIDQPKADNGTISGYNWGSDFRNQKVVEVGAAQAVGVDWGVK
jgi:plastocyanin